MRNKQSHVHHLKARSLMLLWVMNGLWIEKQDKSYPVPTVVQTLVVGGHVLSRWPPLTPVPVRGATAIPPLAVLYPGTVLIVMVVPYRLWTTHDHPPFPQVLRCPHRPLLGLRTSTAYPPGVNRPVSLTQLWAGLGWALPTAWRCLPWHQ